MDLSALELDEEVKAFLKSQTDFTIDGVSQEGGNCDIFFGDHRIFGRRIALKVYYGSDESTSHYEAQALVALDHPNILRVRDARRIGPYYSYFMTDEIDGGDLEKCFRNKELDLRDKLNAIHGTLNGLTELHKDAISIVHRDLKPKNILLYRETKQPLIADFGSIKHFDLELGYVTGSKTTLIYTPLEVFDGHRHSKQSDLYQVGVGLFQILGGFFPDTYDAWLTEKERKRRDSIVDGFDRSVFIEKVIQRLVTQNKLLRLDTLPDYLDPQIVKVISKATNARLQTRYSTTGEFMADLMKAQVQLTNWKESDDALYADKQNGDKYRVVCGNKGYFVEKRGILGMWRRSGDFADSRRELCQSVNNK
ncbi:MAG: serine/threonine protein kinase [Pyrinomonadaceae bacterium]